jgi:hypothetical protein
VNLIIDFGYNKPWPSQVLIVVRLVGCSYVGWLADVRLTGLWFVCLLAVVKLARPLA